LFFGGAGIDAGPDECVSSTQGTAGVEAKNKSASSLVELANNGREGGIQRGPTGMYALGASCTLLTFLGVFMAGFLGDFRASFL
jgi:hypothetical protein